MANVVVHKARIGCVEFRSRDGVVVVSVIVRFYDAFGRDAGYALNGVRQSTLSYVPATGRLVTMLTAGSDTPFTWSYLSGSDLKSSLAYPNGLTASRTYGNRGELLEVNNASPTGTISKYAYTYDAAGRRVACAKSGTAFERSDSVNYGYNARSELTSATAAVDSDYSYGYNFDDIGNRKTSSERGINSVYTASQLNQYTAVDDFTPTYDADGNQIRVKTATGTWQVSYNGENRPVRWTQGDTVITMSFDRMGRRVTKDDQRFVYNGYLQIANFRSTTTTSDYNYFVWDPTEPVATRPLVWHHGSSVAYYTHDGNKNVSEVIDSNNDVAAHYEYAPFGALTVSRGASAEANPWRFSSEYAEDDTATVYYNYRHYEPVTGRWMSRDPSGERDASSLVLFVRNAPLSYSDRIGLDKICTHEVPGVALKDLGLKEVSFPIYVGKDAKGNPIYAAGKVELSPLAINVCCKCLPKTSGRKYTLVVQVKSSYKIKIVGVGKAGNIYTQKAGYGLRSQDGYDRTKAHEELHVAHILSTMNEIYNDLMKDIPATFPRKQCGANIAMVVSRKPDAQGKWDVMKMNENAHSGEGWDEWRETDGKTETDPELW